MGVVRRMFYCFMFLSFTFLGFKFNFVEGFAVLWADARF